MMLPEARMAPWDLPALRTAAAAAPLPTRRSPPPPPGRTPAPAAAADQQWRSEPPLLRRLRGRGCRPRSGCPGLRSCRRFAGEAATSLEICVKNPSGIPVCFCSCTYRSTLICREKTDFSLSPTNFTPSDFSLCLFFLAGAVLGGRYDYHQCFGRNCQYVCRTYSASTKRPIFNDSSKYFAVKVIPKGLERDEKRDLPLAPHAPL